MSQTKTPPTILLLSRSNAILDSIDIGAIQELGEKVSKNIIGQLDNHRKEIQFRSKNPKAIEVYLPILEIFAERVKEVLENKKTTLPMSPLKGNSGFKHLAKEDIAGVRIVNSKPGKEQLHTPTRIKGWTSENLLQNKK